MNRSGPYEFEIVPFSKINPNDYMTISIRGVTHYSNGELEYQDLSEWQRDQERKRAGRLRSASSECEGVSALVAMDHDRYVCDARARARRGGRSRHERLEGAPAIGCRARPHPLVVSRRGLSQRPAARAATARGPRTPWGLHRVSAPGLPRK